MRGCFALLQWLALIHFVLAVDRAAINPAVNISSSRLTGSVSSTTSSIYGGSSATATSTVTTSSLPGNVTSVASGHSTQAQLKIPIKPTSFTPFPVPSDNPMPPNYPAVYPSQPLSVRYTKLSFLTWDVRIIFYRWGLLKFPILDLRGQPHTLRQRQR